MARLVLERLLTEWHWRVNVFLARHARGSARDGTRLMIWESTNTTFHVVEYWLRRAFAPEGKCVQSSELGAGVLGGKGGVAPAPRQ